jgi:hypothetical protein
MSYTSGRRGEFLMGRTVAIHAAGRERGEFRVAWQRRPELLGWVGVDPRSAQALERFGMGSGNN